MKCSACEADARGTCAFCGRGICTSHIKHKDFFSGFGQKIKDNLWPSGSDTGVIVRSALWCGICEVEYQRTH